MIPRIPATARVLVAALACAGLVLHGAAARAAGDPEATKLIAEHHADAAFARLAPRLDAESGDPEFDYLYGVAALESGHAVDAIMAFERVLDAQPGNVEARAYLARALFEAGENDSARREFETARQAELPATVSADIDRYLSTIASRMDRDRARYGFYLETTGGYDSNVNNATSERLIAVPALGGLNVALAPSSREQSSAVWAMGAGGAFTQPLRDKLALVGDASTSYRLPTGAGAFDQFYGNANLGLEYQASAVDTVRLAAAGQQFLVDGARNRVLGGATAQWQHMLDQRTQVMAFGQFAALRYPHQDFRDANRAVGGLGIGHVFDGRGTPVVFASVYGGAELAERGNADQVGRDLGGVRLGGRYTFDARWFATWNVDYEYSRYHADEPAFARTRREHFYDVAVGVRYRLGPGLGAGLTVGPQILWSRNDTNLAVFGYDRWETSMTIRQEF